MARLESVADQFPVGTTVAAYRVSNWPAGTRAQTGIAGAPLGSSDGSGTVAADGSLTIAGLAPFTDYVAYANVGGQDRYRRFRQKAGQAAVSVGTTATLLTGAKRPRSVAISPTNGSINVGYGPGVTTATGIAVAQGASWSEDNFAGELWGITAAGTVDTRVLEA
jgi:hypothetical protein